MRSGTLSESDDARRAYRKSTLRVGSEVVFAAPVNARIAEISLALSPNAAVIALRLALCTWVGGGDEGGMIRVPDKELAAPNTGVLVPGPQDASMVGLQNTLL